MRVGRLLILFAVALLSVPFTPPATADELQWNSPTKSERTVQSDGTWTKRGQGGRVTMSKRVEHMDRSCVRQVAHHEPAEADDNSLRSLQSVVVRRSESTSLAARPNAVQPASGWRTNDFPRQSGRVKTVAANQIHGGQIVDPFEDDFPETVDVPATDASNTLRDTQTDQETTPAEPKPFGTTPIDDDANATTTRDLFPEAGDTLSPSGVDADNKTPLDTGDAKEMEFRPKYLDDYDLDDDQQRGQEACDKQLGRLKSHTLRPWRDTQKEGWEQRGDEVRDLLNIRIAGTAGSDYPFECGLGNEPYMPRMWPETTYAWESAALYHKPLYFENVSLERYGHSWGPFAQPIISGAHFFVTVPFLPYKMGLKTPNECVYTLGHYRPGNCAPYLIDPIPVTWRAILFEAGVITGISAIVP